MALNGEHARVIAQDFVSLESLVVSSQKVDWSFLTSLFENVGWSLQMHLVRATVSAMRHQLDHAVRYATGPGAGLLLVIPMQKNASLVGFDSVMGTTTAVGLESFLPAIDAPVTNAIH